MTASESSGAWVGIDPGGADAFGLAVLTASGDENDLLCLLRG